MEKLDILGNRTQNTKDRLENLLEENQRRETGRPCYCIKVKDSNGVKTFINVCSSPFVPPSHDLDAFQLDDLNNIQTQIHVSMAFGESHTELDIHSEPCDVYDVIVNTDYGQRAKDNLEFQRFLNHLIVKGLSEKCGKEFGDYTVLKNRKKLGEIREQIIRTKPRSLKLVKEAKEEKELVKVKVLKTTRSLELHPKNVIVQFSVDKSIRYDSCQIWRYDRSIKFELFFREKLVFEIQTNLPFVVGECTIENVDFDNRTVNISAQVTW
ncbi:hypothetical protein ACOME3_002198 [Neoechinorhynchus agilis]